MAHAVQTSGKEALILILILDHVPIHFVSSSQTAAVSTTTSSSSQPLTQAQQAPAVFNMPQPKQADSTAYTYNQPTDPTITSAPPPAYGFQSNYSTYDEKDNEKSDLAPPYQPPAYQLPSCST